MGPAGGVARHLLSSGQEKEEVVCSASTSARAIILTVTYLRPEQVLRLTIEPECPCTCPW